MPTNVARMKAGNSIHANAMSGFTQGGNASGLSTPRSIPSWHKEWDLDMRRFWIRKWRSDEDEGGEQWQVIDFDALRVVALSDDRHDAEIVADALEHLSLTTPAGEFDKALAHA